ncbi:hypothetical protein Gpo141_00003639 [Globisporangium polare]
MEEMAAMLNEYAGGLQQSFSTVFDRVGQSLAQSAQMMQMMNDVMEAALLQSLRVECDFDAATKELLVTVANHSQILLGDVTLSVLSDTTESHPASTAASPFNRVFETLSPGAEHVVRVPLPVVPVAGRAELTFRSPGTQAPLQKSSPFRVSFFQTTTFQPVKPEEVAINSVTSSSASSNVDLQRLRGILRLSPLDAMLTQETGAYLFAAGPENALYLLTIILGSGRTAGNACIQIAAGRGEDASPDLDAMRLSCEALLQELEASTQ